MNRSTVTLHGVFPPIPTPFDETGGLATQALRENLARWNTYDLAGYVVLGSNGEVVYLSEAEKLHVLETARHAIPDDKVLIAGTGCEATHQTIALTQKAAAIGVDAALVLAPHYYGNRMTPDALVQHYHAVADAASLPIILYNMPKYTHVDMDAATIARAAQHPNIIGIKDSSGNITKLGDIVRLTRQTADASFQVLAGSASFLFAGLALGAVGGVLALANIAPARCIEIYRWFREGQWEEAAALQRRMIPVNTAITAQFGIAGLKGALDMLGYYGGPVRPPLLPLSDAERETLREILEEGGIKKD
jgi:4-hydroxy-2-oxoglutarate aldolase